MSLTPDDDFEYFELPELNDKQKELIRSGIHNKSTLFVAGWGLGKSVAGAYLTYKYVYSTMRGLDGAWFAPTYGQITKSLLNAYQEIIPESEFRVRKKDGVYYIEHYNVEGIDYAPKTYFLSAEKPQSLESMNLAYLITDEAQDIDRETKDKVLGRLRKKGVSTRFVALGLPIQGTWLEDEIVNRRTVDEDGKPHYHYIGGSTYDNQHNLSDDYIPRLKAALTEEMFKSRVLGQFSKADSIVFSSFSNSNISEVSINKSLPLYAAIDFNITNTNATIIQWNSTLKLAFAIDSIDREYSTLTMCESLSRYIRNLGMRNSDLTIIPDMNSGNARSQIDGRTNIEIMISFGFNVVNSISNPDIELSTGSLCKMFEQGRFIISPKCDKLIVALKSLKIQNQRKSTDPHKHYTDTVRYAAHYLNPIEIGGRYER